MELLSPTPVPTEARDAKAAAREFANEHVRPRAQEFDASGAFPHEIVREAQAAGLAGSYVPAEHGGAGWTLADRLGVIEEWFRADGGIGLSLQLVDFGAKVLMMAGSPEQKAEWLPPVGDGDVITGLAATEPAGGSDLAGMTTTARREGDEYVLDGEKYWTSNGAVADWIVVYAQTGEPGHDGYSLFVVPTDTDGYEAEPITDKMGLRASQQARVQLSGVRVPHDRDLYDAPVADKQTVRHRLVEMREQFEAARALTWQACEHVMAGEDAPFWASLAKSHATRTAEEIAATATQLHGGEGLREENRINRVYRDAKYPPVYEGANAVQRDLAYGHWPDQ
ncbi:acyl-CoA dehydrogenase [Halobacteriales archaeon QH_10_67_13]|nr:MAG: acyl-CoA dehydrogenase [Halobacteriales archaeon QH_10_67_13]